MIANFTHETDSEVWLVAVHFQVSPGEPRTWDYPGSPPELEITGFRVREYERHFAHGQSSYFKFEGRNHDLDLDTEFAALVDADAKLMERIEQECWETAGGAWA